MRSLFWVGRYKKDSWFLQRFIVIVKSFMKLDKLNHKTIVGTCNDTFLLNERLSFFVIVSILEDNICYNQGNRARYSLNAMNENILFFFVCILNEINNSIEKTLNVLILRIFEEKSKVGDVCRLEPIFAIITCTIYNMFYLILLKDLIIFCNFLTRDIKSLYDFTALLLTFLSFTSSLLWSVCHSTS